MTQLKLSAGAIATGDRTSGVSFYLCCTPQVYKNYTNTVSEKQGIEWYLQDGIIWSRT